MCLSHKIHCRFLLLASVYLSFLLLGPAVLPSLCFLLWLWICSLCDLDPPQGSRFNSSLWDISSVDTQSCSVMFSCSSCSQHTGEICISNQKLTICNHANRPKVNFSNLFLTCRGKKYTVWIQHCPMCDNQWMVFKLKSVLTVVLWCMKAISSLLWSYAASKKNASSCAVLAPPLPWLTPWTHPLDCTPVTLHTYVIHNLSDQQRQHRNCSWSDTVEIRGPDRTFAEENQS
jgi:hypothetical protein